MTHALGVLLSLCPAVLIDDAPATKTSAVDMQVPAAVARPVDFAKDIKPILESRCYGCHGPKKQEGDLRFDVRDDALEGGLSGPPFVAGKATESLMFRLAAGLEGRKIMPPKGKGERLSAEQLGILRGWIEQGAVWPENLSGVARTISDHWAYQPVTKPEPPKVEDEGRVRNPIDRFVLAKLAERGMKPSPEADRAVLLRRLSLDLIGLPPTPAEVDAFLKDDRPDAYERQVDRLLASPHYGERWARLWLDLARYADTHGFEKDPIRTMWRFREWVIDALNRDVPFDRFTIEQIAGDMLPNATLDQKIASGFHRNTMFNTEGGVDPEEARVATIVDRVNTTATVWLGTTMGCCQCHSHKYDPFQQKEYYQFYAFLNNCDEPEIAAPTAEFEAKREAYRKELAALEEELKRTTPESQVAQAAWETEVAGGWSVLEPIGALSAGGATLKVQPDHSVLASGTNPNHDAYFVVASTDARTITGLRLELLPDPSLPQGSLGRHSNGSFILSQLQVLAAPKGQRPRSDQAVTFEKAAADFAQEGHSAANLIDGKSDSGWAAETFKPERRVPVSAFFRAKEPIKFENGTTLAVTLIHESQWPEANVGRFRIWVSTGPDPLKAAGVPEKVRQALAVPAEKRNDAQKDVIAAHYRSLSPELKPILDKIAALKKTEPKAPTAMVLKEREKPRETRLMVRGNFLTPGDKVEPGVPAVLPPLPSDAPPNRLTLARWLVDPSNPLTARVIVNRFWEPYFGRGIVETIEDFGTQGTRPTHPELLDWLASEFIERDWSLKALHRLIVTSATYRQASRVTPESYEQDPDNRWLARGPRFRMDAEIIRDNALAISGLLSRKIGGPSVFPPQPEGIWTMIYSNDKWITSKGEDKYRRGLYTFWRRTAPYPTFMAFDAPSREFACIRRPRTNTPLQALATLNDPAFVEMAQGLARRILKEGGSDPKARADYGFRLCVARAPRENEIERLTAFYETELRRFRDAKEEAAQVVGDLPRPEGSDLAELAAWTVAANVLLNLDETITKE